MSGSHDSQSPVLSLTVLDGSSFRDGVVSPDARVLVAVRSERANRTHPKVVSVPTQRLPRPLFAAICAGAPATGDAHGAHVTHFAGATLDSRRHSGLDSVVYAVESLLARKLGLADALEDGCVEYTAALRARVDGIALYDELDGRRDVHEPISMLNVVVVLDRGADLVPPLTASYSALTWAPVARFLAGVDRRDPRAISDELDPIELCVHGVCLAAAQTALARLLDEAVSPLQPSHAARR